MLMVVEYWRQLVSSEHGGRGCGRDQTPHCSPGCWILRGGCGDLDHARGCVPRVPWCQGLLHGVQPRGGFRATHYNIFHIDRDK